MFFLIVFVLFVIILILSISYFSYRLTFFAPNELREHDYVLPSGKQYAPHLELIQKSIDKLLTIEFEPVTIESHDGKKLFARYYHTSDGAPVQILFHGYKSYALLDQSGASHLQMSLGHNVLLVDQRAHGKSEGHTISFGILERRDCLAWIHYVQRRFGKDVRIILCGLSMGAATVLMAADLNLPKNVVGIIADCPYSSPKEIICKVCRDLKFPPFLLYPFIKLGARIFGGFSLEESSAIEAVTCTKIPILIIHGDDDRFVPHSMSEDIKKAGGDHVSLETVAAAGHGLCYMVGPQQYERAVKTFLNLIL